jgi:hypothetical protein
MWFYISFADSSRPKGTQFMGAVIVRGADIEEAAREAWRLGINPGGEALGVPLPEGQEPPQKFRERLLQPSDIRDAFEHTGTRGLVQGGANSGFREYTKDMH